jgi:hypothetical protein
MNTTVQGKPPNVLLYRRVETSHSTVWRHYLKQRKEPLRCDNVECRFHTEPLLWNGKPLVPILDHINGVNSDNRPGKPPSLLPELRFSASYLRRCEQGTCREGRRWVCNQTTRW